MEDLALAGLALGPFSPWGLLVGYRQNTNALPTEEPKYQPLPTIRSRAADPPCPFQPPKKSIEDPLPNLPINPLNQPIDRPTPTRSEPPHTWAALLPNLKGAIQTQATSSRFDTPVPAKRGPPGRCFACLGVIRLLPSLRWWHYSTFGHTNDWSAVSCSWVGLTPASRPPPP
jgi:hypothetical protein